MEKICGCTACVAEDVAADAVQAATTPMWQAGGGKFVGDECVSPNSYGEYLIEGGDS